MGEVYDLGEMNLDAGQEPKAVEAGQEVKVTIIGCKKDVDKNDHKYIQPRFEMVDFPLSKDFTAFFHIPDVSWMTAKQLNGARFGMKNFLTCFGIDPASRISFEDDLPGHTGWVIVGKSESDEYGEQNFVKKFVVKR